MSDLASSMPKPAMATGIPSLRDFRLQRSWMAALGFYLAYVVIGGFLGFIFVSVLSAILMPQATYEQGFAVGVLAGRLLAMIYVTSIFGVITYKRRAWRNWIYLIGLLLSVVLACFVGALGGLLPTGVLLCIRGPEPTTKS
jgi:hypothetical protein